jgi:hypothetical protein
VILVHSYLGVEWDSAGIVYGGSTLDRDDPAEAFAVPHRRFNPTQAAIIVCDEDPTQSLIERRYLKKDALCSVTDGGLGELISAGLDAPSGLLSYLHSAAISPERMRAAAETLRLEEMKRGQVTDPSAPSAHVWKATAEAAPLVRLSRVLDRLADELACGRTGPAYSLLVNGDGLIAQGRKPWAFDEQRLLVLDGTANPEIMRQFVPTLAAEPEIRVERNARIIQVKNATFYKGSLIKRVSDANGRGKPEPTERLLEVGDFIERTAHTGKTLVVTNKPVRCALTGEDQDGKLPVSSEYRGADVAHFGNLRGSNEFEGHDAMIILGRDEPSVRAAEQRAMAIWYDTQKPIDEVRLNARGRVKYRSRVGRYQMRDGSTIHARVSKPWSSGAEKPRWCRRLTGCGSFTTKSARASTFCVAFHWTFRLTSS